MDARRRSFLSSTLFGAGALGLRALATGLPMSVLARAGRADAEPAPTCTITDPHALVLITSASGDPLNANVPGCYAHADIYHPLQATMAPTPMTLGGSTYTAALPWTQLDATLQARTSFIHHATYTNAHGDAPKVHKLMGAVSRQEMMVSLFASKLAPCLGSVQRTPMVISPGLVTSAGAAQPVVDPRVLQRVLAAPGGPLATLQQRRDADVDRLNALFKASGRKADLAILDRYALSQSDARKLSQVLLADLAAITGATRTDLNIATAVLLKMNVSPAVVLNYGFGGDNHADTGLANEAAATIASVAALNDLATRLRAYGLEDKVTIALQNVFGRSLAITAHQGNPDGRNHNAGHHCTVLIGKRLKGSVIGGVQRDESGRDFRARAFDATTGAARDDGDVPYGETLASVGKTLGRALGLGDAELAQDISGGKAIAAALA